MAKELTPEEKAAAEERKKLAKEKQDLKKEQAKQKAEAKKRAKEIAKQEEALDEDKEGNGFVTFLATVFIVLLWLAVVVIVIKLDVGGFGSTVMTPILKDVPVINKILPKTASSLTDDPDSYGLPSLPRRFHDFPNSKRCRWNSSESAMSSTRKSSMPRTVPARKSIASFTRKWIPPRLNICISRL